MAHAQRMSRGTQSLGIRAAPWLWLAAVGCGSEDPTPSAEETPSRLVMALRGSGPATLDPLFGSTAYEHLPVALVCEPLLQWDPLAETPRLQPLLLEELPTSADGGTTWAFTLREGVRFHDAPCFPGGRGRTLTAADVLWSWKRMAAPTLDPGTLPKGPSELRDAIAGFRDFEEQLRQSPAAAAARSLDGDVSGLRIVDERRFEVTLNAPFAPFLWLLARFPLSIVPHEAVLDDEHPFDRHPVGTGPFTLSSWTENRLTFRAFESYHGGPAGPDANLPGVDELILDVIAEDSTAWLEWEAGRLDMMQVPGERFSDVFIPSTHALRESWSAQGVQARAIPLHDFIFRGFDMEDERLGGDGEAATALRHALRLAVDHDEFNRTIYNGTATEYDGMIPPGLAGHPLNGRVLAFDRGPNLAKANALLVEAGFPEGEGLEPIEFFTSSSENARRQAELLARQLASIGVELVIRQMDFSQLSQAIAEGRAPFFSYAWISDYPDAQNNLSMFYGPNTRSGPNKCGYANAAFDAFYEEALTLPPSDERTHLYEQMRDLVLADAPFIGSLARTRFHIARSWVGSFHPAETCYTWIKHVTVDDVARANR